MTDQERDAHLRAALRHAPDADVQPPPALSALILREAQAKARDVSPAPARAPRHPIWSVWDWLARPAVATGFAGVMVAALLGLMWWDQPMDEAMPRPPVPAAARAPASAPVSEPAEATPPAAPMAEATRPAQHPMPAPQRKSAPVAKPAAAAAPAPEVAAREEAPAPTARVRSQSLEESKRQRSMASADALNKAAQAETRQVDTRNSIAQVRAAIAYEPARWTWQRAGAAPLDMTDAVFDWLAQLESTTGTRWQARPERDTAAPLGRELRLLRDGRVQHSLRLSERGVSWESGQSAWQTELTATQLAELQAALDRAAP